MNVTVFTASLTTDWYVTEVTVHGTFEDAVASLRQQGDPKGRLAEVADEDLAAALSAVGQTSAFIDTSVVNVPSSAFASQCPVLIDHVQEALAERDVPDSAIINMEQFGKPVWQEALDAGFAPHAEEWAAIKSEVTDRTIAILLDMVAADNGVGAPDDQ